MSYLSIAGFRDGPVEYAPLFFEMVWPRGFIRRGLVIEILPGVQSAGMFTIRFAFTTREWLT